MAWKKVYQNRLKKLADHLMTGKLGHKKFSFADYNSSPNSMNIPYKCGFSGCAIGECPVIFRQWKFNVIANPVLKNHGDPADSAMDFFDINSNECDHLFMPNEQICGMYGGEDLLGYSTREQVARNIYAFIKIKSKEK